MLNEITICFTFPPNRQEQQQVMSVGDETRAAPRRTQHHERQEMSSTTAAKGKYGRVFDGKSFRDVDPPDPPPPTHSTLRRRWRRSAPSSSHVVVAPVPPVFFSGGGGDDADHRREATIFVSVPQFRDGRRCGRTLKRLFENAKFPDRVSVGLVEQTDPDRPDDDPTCLREYCALVGGGGHDRVPGGGGDEEEDGESEGGGRRDAAMMRDCPRASSQIRSVRFSHLYAKGPVYARSFVRKILGNEG